MIGYPKHIATIRDYENLLVSSEFRERARVDLTAVLEADDATTKQVISVAVDGKEETTTIDNPMPLWKIKGISDRAAAAKLIGKEIVEQIEIEEVER